MDAKMEITELPLHLIDEDTDQPRYQFDDEAIQELMNSIAELGLLSPIKVRKLDNGRFKIIYGNRRYKASKKLGRQTIPCIVSHATDELEIYLEQMAENLTREGFSPVEEAEAFHKLMNHPKFSSSVKFLSGKLGKPETYIKNKLELLKFDAKVRKLVVSGTDIRKDKLTEDQLLPLKDLPMEYRDSLALIAARDELPVSDIKRIAKLFKSADISDGTKGKLLYKSGYELLQTWSTYEANRKERAERARRAAEEAAANAASAPGSDVVAVQTAAADQAATAKQPAAAAGPDAASANRTSPFLPASEAAVTPGTQETPASAEAGTAPMPYAATGSLPLGPHDDLVATAIDAPLQQLLASLPETTVAPPPSLTTEAIGNLNDPERRDKLIHDTNQAISLLEAHLDAWRKTLAQLTSKS